MAHGAVHDLTPAYALDALDEHERVEYEAHLATCDQCREELTSLQETAASLAFVVAAPAPPPALRERVLEAARDERSNVVVLRPRRVTYALGAVAAAAAALAVGVGIWAAQLAGDLDRERAVAAILADPDARTVPLQGANGRIVVTETGEAALIVAGLPAAPEGKTYEAWVIEGETPRPAGLFDGEAERDVFLLSRPVPPRAAVAVTIEPAGGSESPTSTPIFTTRS